MTAKCAETHPQSLNHDHKSHSNNQKTAKREREEQVNKRHTQVSLGAFDDGLVSVLVTPILVADVSRYCAVQVDILHPARQWGSEIRRRGSSSSKDRLRYADGNAWHKRMVHSGQS